MKRRLDELTENASALGAAGLDLAKAEASALSGELKLSGKSLVRVLILLALCATLLFWFVAVFLYFGIEVAAIWMPRWGAALTVLGVLLLALLGVGMVAWRRLQRLETPGATVRRRLEDHRDWWERRLGRRNG